MTIPSVALADGRDLPLLGMGTYKLSPEGMEHALGAGYRLLDTAAQYDNEEEVGRAIAASGIPRDELRVMTKLRGSQHGEARAGLEGSLERLGLDHVDLYLIHWPNPSANLFVTAFAEMLRMRDEGLVGSVGVSNFNPRQLQRLHDEAGEWPVVNQIQCSPLLARRDLRAFHAEQGITSVGWGPLGLREGLPDRPEVAAVAEATGRTVSQVVLAWSVQRGIVAIPKSSDAERQRENLGAFDVELTDEQWATLDALDLGEGAAWDSETHEEF